MKNYSGRVTYDCGCWVEMMPLHAYRCAQHSKPPVPVAPHYSGPASVDFWKDINALPEPQLGTAYTLGVVLQNVETDILRLIDHQVRDAHAAWGPPTEGD